MNIAKTFTTLWKQDGTVTYASIVRPLIGSVGGAGYLQNFDAINNLASLDNAESRVVRRINVANQLRSAGREMELDVRTSRGMVAMPNPIKPHVANMAMAAYANDASGFREAYERALAAAYDENAQDPKPGDDPRADVAEAFERMHPLRSVFSKAPTKQEYQILLGRLGDSAEDVASAIRNFNGYAAQIPKGRGKEGIKPFYGTDRSEGQASRQAFSSFKMPSFSSGGGSSWRDAAASFR
jgi:hypothetical protein